MKKHSKEERLLEIFFRVIKEESISVRELANEYGVSTRSIARDISEIKTFLAEHRELVGVIELEYDYKSKRYYSKKGVFE